MSIVTKKSALEIYNQVYKQGKLFGIDKKLATNPFKQKNHRANSVAVAGGMFGDEGKGRIADEITAGFLKKHKQVWHYRDNGGANAGHTIMIGDIKIALHQIGAGILQKGCTAVLGKEMVIHPEDLVLELKEASKVIGKKLPSKLIIDEMAFSCLDTHRAFESVLSFHSQNKKASTGRGISPAYADIIYRHPLRMRDLVASDWKKRIKKHYDLYANLVKGFNFQLSKIEVVRLDGSLVKVGTLEEFLNRLAKAKKIIKPFIAPAYQSVKKMWASDIPVVFEKAQALGLDKRWGVYPDVTASNCGFDGIHSSTEGIVDHRLISAKIATIKATYSSSVGNRKLPTEMDKKLTHRIREDAHEYGATTKRPRDVVHLDLPMMSYLSSVGRVEYLAITHMDISYLDRPLKICVGYTKDGKQVDYRPDQEFLNTVKPIYLELPAWDSQVAIKAKTIKQLPKEALQYLAFITQSLGLKLLMVTTGPKRDQTVKWW